MKTSDHQYINIARDIYNRDKHYIFDSADYLLATIERVSDELKTNLRSSISKAQLQEINSFIKDISVGKVTKV